jgi:aspartyl-tRNA(Asn)/glutamyl-tRNA(Gln) amidotransferase subunit C
MSTLNTEAVMKIAHLARLNMDEKSAPQYVRELSNILQLVEQMDQVDTKDVAPMAHPMDVSQRLRADVATEKNQRELFQSIAPQVEAGLYLVPQVIE